MKTNYEVTIGYKAIITVQVRAESREEAETKAVSRMDDRKRKMLCYDLQIMDDTFKSDGVLDMDATWNQLNN